MSHRRRPCQAGFPRRGGVVLIGVIVGLAIASAIWFSLIKTSMTERQVVRRQQWDIQARELALAALDRTAARLAADDTYTGETWRLPAEALDGRQAAAVVIEVSQVAQRPQRREIRVQASFPATGEQRASHTLKTTIDLASERDD